MTDLDSGKRPPLHAQAIGIPSLPIHYTPQVTHIQSSMHSSPVILAQVVPYEEYEKVLNELNNWRSQALNFKGIIDSQNLGQVNIG